MKSRFLGLQWLLIVLTVLAACVPGYFSPGRALHPAALFFLALPFSGPAAALFMIWGLWGARRLMTREDFSFKVTGDRTLAPIVTPFVGALMVLFLGYSLALFANTFFDRAPAEEHRVRILGTYETSKGFCFVRLDTWDTKQHDGGELEISKGELLQISGQRSRVMLLVTKPGRFGVTWVKAHRALSDGGSVR